tara:strand:+ start:3676 stop:4113 length:438 start_codon:yes stop_codon:yes gene_type:complete
MKNIIKILWMNLIINKQVIYYIVMKIQKNLIKRMLLFLFGCMSLRIGFVYLAHRLSKKNLKYMGYLAIMPAIGFIYIYLTGIRATGAEVFGDKIWWNNLRPIHSVLYFIFAYMAINSLENSYLPLLIDVIIGFISFLVYHLFIRN